MQLNLCSFVLIEPVTIQGSQKRITVQGFRVNYWEFKALSHFRLNAEHHANVYQYRLPWIPRLLDYMITLCEGTACMLDCMNNRGFYSTQKTGDGIFYFHLRNSWQHINEIVECFVELR